MRVTGWRNGTPKATGSGYGIRITRKDRDRYFKPEWDSVYIQTDKDTIEIKLSSSFWKNCKELRSSELGKWMIEKGIAPWAPRKTPSMILESLGNRKFRLR